MTAFEEKILTLLEGMQTEQQGMKTELVNIKTEQQGIKTELSGIHTRLESIETEQQGMKQQLTSLDKNVEHIHGSVATIEEVHGQKIGALYDSIVISKELTRDFNELKGAVERIKFGDEVIRFVNAVETKASH